MIILYILILLIWLFPLVNCIMILGDIIKETREIDVFYYFFLILFSTLPLLGFMSITLLDDLVDKVYNSILHTKNEKKLEYWRKYHNSLGIYPLFLKLNFFKLKIKI